MGLGGVPWLRHFTFPVLFTLVAVPWISLIETPIIEGLMRIIAAVAAGTGVGAAAGKAAGGGAAAAANGAGPGTLFGAAAFDGADVSSLVK